MKVKIGDKWYEPTPNAPIMIVLNNHDKFNLSHMDENDTKYAEFHDDDEKSITEMQEWMSK